MISPAMDARASSYPDLKMLAKAGFSERDIEILDLIQHGCTDAQVANACGISVSGVRKHLNKIAARLGASGRVETVSRAIATCREMEMQVSLGVKPTSAGGETRR